MKFKYRSAHERGSAEHGWLHARFTFSFANYYDPEHNGFHTLQVMNNDVIEPGGGFPSHPHHDAEIFTYVLSGKLEHKDSMGNGSVIEAGDLQYMSAGEGVQHSEFNPSDSEKTELYQIWMRPNQKGGKPRYAEKKLSEIKSLAGRGAWVMMQRSFKEEIKDEKIRFSKRSLDKDPLDWFKDNNKKVGDIITTRVHEVMKTGVKVSIDNDKKIVVSIRKSDLAKSSADARPEVFSPGNALDAKITELDLEKRKIKLSVKAAQIDEKKSLVAKFGEGATKSGATLKGIFEKAIGKKGKKEK